MTETPSPVAEARKQIETALIERAGEDPAFRTLLKSDPHAALESLLGVDPLPSMKLRVIEEEAGEAVLVLPRRMSLDELSDDLLDLASGGFYMFEPGGRVAVPTPLCK